MSKLFGVVSLLVLFVFSCKHDPYQYSGNEDPAPPILPGDTCDETLVYFNEVEMVFAGCAISGCHDGSNSKAYRLISHQDIVINALEDDDIADWEESDLYERLVKKANDPDEVMPPPPMSPLSAETIELLKKWVEQGATNKVCGGCDTTDVTYTNQIKNVISTSCQSCHNSSPTSQSIDLTNYLAVSVSANNILDRISRNESANGFMPRNGMKNDCNIDLMEKWILNNKKE